MNRIWKWLLDAEPTELAGSDEWELSFIADLNNYMKLALIAGLAALIYLVIRSYRREGEAPRKAKAILAGLRITVLLLAVLIVLRPAIVLKFSKTLFSDVIFLVDDSLSMSFDDDYDAETRRKLSRFLDVDEGQIEALSRQEILRRALLRADGPLEALARDHPMTWMSFSTDQPEQGTYVRTVGKVDLTAEPARKKDAASARTKEILAGLSARGYHTKIPVALGRALQEVQGRRATLVLLSDGQNTEESEHTSLQHIKERAVEQGVPIRPVLVGSPRRPTHVAVAELRGPERVIRGSQARFSVRVAYCNTKQDHRATVRLLRRAEGDDRWDPVAAAPQPVLLEKPTQEQFNRTLYTETIEIEHTPREVGRFSYKAVVEPAAGDEPASDALTVTVRDEKIRVLLVSADAGWEFQYLRNFLLRQVDLYRVSVWQQNADPAVNQAASSGMKLERLPRTLAELIGSPGGEPYPGYNVVVLYDPEPTREGFDEPFAEMLHKFVYDHGGGLCYIVGNKHTEEVLGRKEFALLRDLTPVELSSDTREITMRIRGRRPEPWRIRVTPYGTDHPVMLLGQTPEQSLRVWEALPGIYWSHPVRRPKKGARVLGVHSNPLRRTAKDEPEPVVVFQPYGTGRVLYLGSDETWRWRFGADGEHHRKFWTNALRFLATMKPRVVEVILSEGRKRVDVGKPVKIEVRAHNDKYQPLQRETFDVDVVDLRTDALRKVTLRDVPGDPGKYRGRVTFDAEGDYEITALSGDPLQGEKVASKRIEARLPEAEARNPQADAAFLGRAASGGRYHRIWEIDELAEDIPAGRLTAVTPVPHELWDSKLMLLIVVVLLCGEWILRKKYNMT